MQSNTGNSLPRKSQIGSSRSSIYIAGATSTSTRSEQRKSFTASRVHLLFFDMADCECFIHQTSSTDLNIVNGLLLNLRLVRPEILDTNFVLEELVQF